jgi:hypothetical protein
MPEQKGIAKRELFLIANAGAVGKSAIWHTFTRGGASAGDWITSYGPAQPATWSNTNTGTSYPKHLKGDK